MGGLYVLVHQTGLADSTIAQDDHLEEKPVSV